MITYTYSNHQDCTKPKKPTNKLDEPDMITTDYQTPRQYLVETSKAPSDQRNQKQLR